MNTLKDLAYRAKNRLLNKELRQTYSNAGISVSNNMNLFNNNKNKNEKVYANNKFSLREAELSLLSDEEKEKYLLNSIKKYFDDKNRLNKDASGF